MESVSQATESRREKLNTLVAITIALLATFTGVCKVKDDNIVQAMQQAQADRVDHWAWYQSLHTREEELKDQLLLLNTQKMATDAAHQVGFTEAMKATEEKLAHVEKHKENMASQAKADQASYDALNYRDDQFDLSDAMMALAISLLAITSLVQKRWLYVLAMIPSSVGVLMGLAGLLGWHIHSDTLASWLS